MKIHILDLLHQGFERAIAAYLLQGSEGSVLIETGPMSTLSTLIRRLKEHDLEPRDVRHVLVTHIHLDHAGAAGWWAQQGATVYVHQVGAPHIIDPSRLWQSASRIYGDDMEKLWGAILPAPEERVVSIGDGDVISVGGLTIKAWDTPGHAWHHHSYQVEQVAFTGDAAGVRLAANGWTSLPAPPPEFHLKAWQNTIDKLRALRLEALYLTHFGKVADPDSHLAQLDGLMQEAATFIHNEMSLGKERDQILNSYRYWNHERASQYGLASQDFDGRYEAANPLFMSVDGIMRYWRKQHEKGEKAA